MSDRLLSSLLLLLTVGLGVGAVLTGHSSAPCFAFAIPVAFCIATEVWAQEMGEGA